MSSLSSKCGGGGWTLVMKLDGNKVKYLDNKQYISFAYGDFKCRTSTLKIQVKSHLRNIFKIKHKWPDAKVFLYCFVANI